MRMTQLVASLFTSQGKALLSYPCYFETTFNPWGEAKQIKIKTDLAIDRIYSMRLQGMKEFLLQDNCRLYSTCTRSNEVHQRMLIA